MHEGDDTDSCQHKWTPAIDGSHVWCIKCSLSWDTYISSKRSWISKCECGATIAGFDSHMHWCPLGNPKQGRE